MDAEDVVVHGEHVKVLRGGTSLGLDSDLSVVNSREVASTGRLMLLGLKCERIRIDAGHGGTSVVLEGLDGVEVLARLLLEAVLAVKHKLEGVDGASDLLSPKGITGGELELGSAHSRGGDETGGAGDRGSVGSNGLRGGGEVPKVGTRHGTVVGAEDELLDRVVVGEADLLGVAGSREGIGAGVLNLLDEVLVTLLGETPTLLSVEVDVVGPDLEGGAIGVLVEFRRQVKIQPALVILKGY